MCRPAARFNGSDRACAGCLEASGAPTRGPLAPARRLNPNEAETEQRVFVESITNQYESRVAVQYLGECGRGDSTSVGVC